MQNNAAHDPSVDPDDLTIPVSRQELKRNLLLKSLGFGGLTYGAMIMYYLGYLPLWGLIAANALFYIRAYLRMHDLCHAFNTRGLVARFLPTALFANPVWGGTTAFIGTHLDHHKYLGTDRDPWINYYCGHPLRAFFFNMIEPEVNLFNHIKYKGFNRKLAENIVFDILFQVLHLVVFQWAYVTHLIIQRICHGISIFLFNFWPHRATFSANASIGNFNRETQLKPWAPLLQLFWGKSLVEAAMYHNRHHIIGQIHEPAHRYVLCSDSGEATRFTKNWPLHSIQKHADAPIV